MWAKICPCEIYFEKLYLGGYTFLHIHPSKFPYRNKSERICERIKVSATFAPFLKRIFQKVAGKNNTPTSSFSIFCLGTSILRAEVSGKTDAASLVFTVFDQRVAFIVGFTQAKNVFYGPHLVFSRSCKNSDPLNISSYVLLIFIYLLVKWLQAGNCSELPRNCLSLCGRIMPGVVRCTKLECGGLSDPV